MVVVGRPAWADQVGFPGDARKSRLTPSWIQVVLLETLLSLHLHQYRLLDIQLVLVSANVQLWRFIVIRVVIIVQQRLPSRNRVSREEVNLKYA